ncbi:hypothetical protein TNCV_4627731 [Trichonephila clavipes]|nr:hypothetical protein TNCV_4627731 [Trichonephila clavipes]
MELVNLSLIQVTRTTPELASFSQNYRVNFGWRCSQEQLNNRSALPSSFEPIDESSLAEEYGTFCKHRAGRYAPYLRVGTINKNIESQKVPTERCTRQPVV